MVEPRIVRGEGQAESLGVWRGDRHMLTSDSTLKSAEGGSLQRENCLPNPAQSAPGSEHPWSASPAVRRAKPWSCQGTHRCPSGLSLPPKPTRAAQRGPASALERLGREPWGTPLTHPLTHCSSTLHQLLIRSPEAGPGVRGPAARPRQQEHSWAQIAS